MGIPDKMIINRNPNIAKIVLLLLITFLGLDVEAGEPEVYYYAGSKKSVSMYDDNQLVWNQNWLKDGEKYLDTIFYSVDTWPEYLNGATELKTHLRDHIVSSQYYKQEMEGTVLLGFVVTEYGDLEGVYIVNEFIYRAGMFEDITFTSRMLFYIYR